MQINLLPWREQARQKKLVRLGIIIGSCAALALLFILIIHLYYRTMIMEQNKINNYLQTQLQDSQNNLATLQEKKSNQVALLVELHFLLNLRTISYQAIRLCNILANATPLAVTLEKVTRTDNLVLIAGQADSDTQVTQFMKNIALARKGKQPELASITTTQGPNGDERHFQLKLPQD